MTSRVLGTRSRRAVPPGRGGREHSEHVQQTALDIVNQFTTSQASREIKQLLRGKCVLGSPTPVGTRKYNRSGCPRSRMSHSWAWGWSGGMLGGDEAGAGGRAMKGTGGV